MIQSAFTLDLRSFKCLREIAWEGTPTPDEVRSVHLRV